MATGNHTETQSQQPGSIAAGRPATSTAEAKEAARLAAIDAAFGAIADASFSSDDLEQEPGDESERLSPTAATLSAVTNPAFTLEKSQAKNNEAIALLQSWLDDDSDAEEQRIAWEAIRGALDEDRLSDRKLFP